MIVGEDSYIWNPNFFKYEDPDDGNYKGNVIGNTPLEIHLDKVRELGREERDTIEDEGNAFLMEIGQYIAKYTNLSTIERTVFISITNEFSSVFTLDASALDGGVLM